MKYLKATILVLLSSLFFISSVVFAQDDVNPSGLSGQGPAFICLDAEWCKENNNCSVPNVHRTRLTTTSTKGAPNSVAYIAECVDGVPGKTGPVCTTGNDDIDKMLFCSEADRETNPECKRYSFLQQTVQYSITHDYNNRPHDQYGYFWQENGQFVKKSPPQALRTNGLGDIIPSVVEVQSSTPDELMRRFVLFTTGTNPERGESGIGGQQQDILTFEQRSQSCRGETYDPEGRTFDAVSLEPIPQTSILVKQLKEGGNRLMASDFSADLAGQTNINISNPYTTAILGYFNFLLVPEEYYRLEASKGGYTMMKKADVAKIPTNASKIYFDVATSRTSYFFEDSDAFYQGTTLLRYDIPMMPIDGKGQNYEMKILTRNQSQSNDGKYLIYEGQISHPFAKLTVQTCSENPKVCNNPQVFTSQNGGPDEFGNFRIQLDQTLLQPGQKYEPTFEKVNLATAVIAKQDIFDKIISWMHKTVFGEVQAQETGNTLTDQAIQPIVSYIEGFAYDNEGNLMPNATVGLYVDLMSKPSYFTTADQNGYYKITSENIPNDKYVIRYTSAEDPKKMATITTSQFTQQNKEFITAEKINTYSLVTRTTDPRRTVTPSYVPQAKISAIPNEFPVTPAITSAPLTPVEEATNNNMFLIGAVLLLLVATAGTLIGVYLYKKRMQEQQL